MLLGSVVWFRFLLFFRFVLIGFVYLFICNSSFGRVRIGSAFMTASSHWGLLNGCRRPASIDRKTLLSQGIHSAHSWGFCVHSKLLS